MFIKYLNIVLVFPDFAVMDIVPAVIVVATVTAVVVVATVVAVVVVVVVVVATVTNDVVVSPDVDHVLEILIEMEGKVFKMVLFFNRL